MSYNSIIQSRAASRLTVVLFVTILVLAPAVGGASVSRTQDTSPSDSQGDSPVTQTSLGSGTLSSFSAATAPGNEYTDDFSGDWNETYDELIEQQGYAITPSGSHQTIWSRVGEIGGEDFNVTYRVTPDVASSTSNANPMFAFYYQDIDNQYRTKINASGGLVLKKTVGGTSTQVDAVNAGIDKTHKFEVNVSWDESADSVDITYTDQSTGSSWTLTGALDPDADFGSSTGKLKLRSAAGDGADDLRWHYIEASTATQAWTESFDNIERWSRDTNGFHQVYGQSEDSLRYDGDTGENDIIRFTDPGKKKVANITVEGSMDAGNQTTGNSSHIHPVFAFQDVNNHYFLDVNANKQKITFKKAVGGTTSQLKNISAELPDDHRYRINVDANQKSGYAEAHVTDLTDGRDWTISATYTPEDDFGTSSGYVGLSELAGYGNATRIYSYKAAVSNVTNTVEGRVVTQNGDSISDATVQVYGVNYSHPDIATDSDAVHSLNKGTVSRPTEFVRQTSSGFSLTGGGGHFEQTDTRYAAVHTPESLDVAPSQLSLWDDAADLSDPEWAAAPPGKPLMFSCWDPSQTGGLIGQLGQSEYDRELPGKHQQDCTITVEQLAGSERVDTQQVKINKTNSGGSALGISDPSEFHYGTVDGLPDGWYQVHPKDSPESSYIIQVGNPMSAMLPDLGVDPSKHITDALNDDKFVQTKVTSGPSGRFSHTFSDSNMKYVAVQAYKAPGLSTDPKNLKLSDIRSAADAGTLNGSIYLPSRVYRTEVPDRNVRVEMREVTHPQYANLSDYFGRLRDLLNTIQNGSFSDLSPALQQRLDSMPRDALEQTLSEMQEFCTQNPDLSDQCTENIRDTTGDPSAPTTVTPDDVSTDELKDRIRALQESMTELQQTVDSETPTAETGDETVSLSFPFDTNLNPENVLVRVHFNNGTSKTLSTDSEYVSINERIGRGDVVKITDYPLGQGDAAVADFEVDVATESGTGSASKAVTNPTFSGEIPSLQSVEFSTLRPGPSENVSVEVHPEDVSKYDKLVGTTVYGPQGSQLNTSSISNGRQVSFDTNGAGPHRVELTFTNPGGVEFTEVVYVDAGHENREWPASLRTAAGPTGVYALVGDGLESGQVDVTNGGSEVDIAAVIPQKADVPTELRVYTNGLETAPDTTTRISVVRGDQQAAVKKHVPVTVHGPSIGEDALVYRNGDPLPRGDGTQYGKTVVQDNQTRYETITTPDGTVAIRVSADPGLLERAIYTWRTTVPDINLPGLAGLPDMGGHPGQGAALLTVGLGGAVAARRRGSS